jgi:putative hydrolase of the HAD superfamily
VGAALDRQGVAVPAAALAAAEPRAKRELDTRERVRAGRDEARGWLYFDLVLAMAGVPRSERTQAALAELREYHAAHNLWESIPEEVPGALARFRALGLRLVVVSNANGTVRAKLARLGLAPHFDLVVDSQEEGVEKPDPRLFEVALARAEARPAATLHVGDLYEVDVVGARAAGLQAALVDRGWLYEGVDCHRVPTLRELADQLEATLQNRWL